MRMPLACKPGWCRGIRALFACKHYFEFMYVATYTTELEEEYS